MDTAALPPPEQFRELDEEGLTALLAKVLGKSWNAERSQKLIDEEIDGRVFLSYQTPEKWRATFGFAQGTCSKLAEIVEFVTNGSLLSAKSASSGHSLDASSRESEEDMIARLTSPGASIVDGKYEVEGPPLGKGSFGRVVMARGKHGKHRKVAVKVTPATKTNRQQFMAEIKILHALDHSNVVSIIECHEEHGAFFIVMPYLVGETMQDLLDKRTKLTQQQTFWIALQVLSALDYLHRRGVIHRDLKPANIFILPNGGVKVLDFGLAAISGQGRGVSQSSVVSLLQSSMRVTGSVLGSAAYMSPEQFMDPNLVDHQADLWAFFVTLYVSMVGSFPWDEGASAQAYAINRSNKAPKLGMFSPELRVFFERGFNTHIRLRFPSADILLKEHVPLLMVRTGHSSFHVFVSYRVNADAKFATDVVEQLSSLKIDGRPLLVYLDYRELLPGEDWQAGFLSALTNCSVFVPIISPGVTTPFCELGSRDKCDNVLLEHEFALELLEQQKLQAIVPVLRGSQRDEHDTKQGFNKYVFPRLPASPSVATKQALHTFMAKCGLTPSPNGQQRTVSEVFSAITRMQGAMLKPETGDYAACVDLAVSQVHEAVLRVLHQNAEEASQSRTTASQPPTPVRVPSPAPSANPDATPKATEKALSQVDVDRLGKELYDAARDGKTDSVRAVLTTIQHRPNKGSVVGWRDRHGSTPLHLAAAKGHCNVVTVLLREGGADASAKDNDGSTPLHHAAGRGHCEVATVLLREGGADASAKNNDGNTPLHCAAYYGHSAVVEALLREEGCDASVKNNKGETALDRARMKNQQAVVALLAGH